jgi:hypothetical protein
MTSGLPMSLPRSSTIQELSSCAFEIFRILGYELGNYYDQKNRARKGPNWFQEYCNKSKYLPNLHDPEFCLKEPDNSDSWCRWTLPQDRDFHSTRKQVKRFRNRLAHFEEINNEELAKFLADVRKLVSTLNLPMSSILPRIQQHIRFLIENPGLIFNDEAMQKLSNEINFLKKENQQLNTQLSSYEKWFPKLVLIEDKDLKESTSDPESVCLHFSFDDERHTVVAKRVSIDDNLATIEFQLPMGIPLGEGDIVSYKGITGSNCASLTGIVKRAPFYRIQVEINYDLNYDLFHLAKVLDDSNLGSLGGILESPDGPLERWTFFWDQVSRALGTLDAECIVVENSTLRGSAVLQVNSSDLAKQVIKLVCQQENGDGWLLSDPSTPIGPVFKLDRFSYAVYTERIIAEAVRQGWYVDSNNQIPDLNRVLEDLEWDPIQDVFVGLGRR